MSQSGTSGVQVENETDRRITSPAVSAAMSVRKMEPGDTARVAAIHVEAFRNFFLTMLGQSFLCQFYRSILAEESGFGYVCERDSEIIGLVAGTSRPEGFYSQLFRRHWWRLGSTLGMAVLRNPRLLPRLFNRLGGESYEMPAKAAALLSIAVAPLIQGGGSGRLLVSAFLREAKDRGAQTVLLTTDRYNNDAVNQFYLRLGFACTSSFTTVEGRAMNVYTFALDPKTI